MKKIVFLVAVAWCGVVAASPAYADTYDTVDLGETPAAYVEHRNSINTKSQVAWTELITVGGSRLARARLTNAATIPLPSGATQDLHSLLVSAGGSYATDFISRAEGINDKGDVVGYATNTPLEFRRHAALWFAETNGSYTVVDLHAKTEAVLSESYDITVAYGVSDRVDGYVYIAGYRRTSLDVLATPTVWRVKKSDGTVSVFTLSPLPNGGSGSGYNYGLLYDVAAQKVGNNVDLMVGGGVGGQQSPGGLTGGAYLYAYYFKVDGASGTVQAQGFVPGVNGSGYATSGVNRVKLFDRDGPGGDDPEYYFAGYGLKSTGEANAFLWRFNASSAEIGGRLTGGDIAIGMGLAMRTDSRAIPGYPQVVGTSSTAAGGVGVADGATPLSGFHAYGELASATDLSRTCDVWPEMSGTVQASFDAVTDMNDSGVIIGWRGDLATVARPTPSNATARFRTLVVPALHKSGWNPPAYNFWWVELEGSDLVDGYVIVSDEPGCSSFGDLAGASCDHLIANLDKPAPPSGQREPSRQLYLPAYARQPGSPLTKVGIASAVTWINDNGFWHNGLTGDTNQSPLPTGYAQVVGVDDSGNCVVSDVIDLTPEPNTSTFQNNICDGAPPTGFANTRDPIFNGDYRDCISGGGLNDGCETDVLEDKRHCGACSTSSNNTAVDDGLSCTTDSCVEGVKTNNIIAGNCAINGACYLDNTRNNWSYTTATGDAGPWCRTSTQTVTSPNPCQICDSDASGSSWTNPGAAACCQNGTPKLDVYDTNTNQGCNYTLGTDRNDGRSQAARWVDPRGYAERYLSFDNWNNGNTCNVGTGPGQVRRVDASFTPYVDTADWYEFEMDDDNNRGGGGNIKTPEPRVRVISRDGQQLRACLFVDCVDAPRGNVDLKSRAIRDGTEVCFGASGICERGWQSPARDARGYCGTTSSAGIVDLEIYDYDCTGTTNEHAWMFVEVVPLGNIDSKTCDQLDYTLYYGNDSVGSGSGGTGCGSCCN